MNKHIRFTLVPLLGIALALAACDTDDGKGTPQSGGDTTSGDIGGEDAAGGDAATTDTATTDTTTTDTATTDTATTDTATTDTATTDTSVVDTGTTDTNVDTSTVDTGTTDTGTTDTGTVDTAPDVATVDATADTDAVVLPTIEIAGTWTNDFGSTETISSLTWHNGFDAMTIVQYDNVANSTITQNPATAQFNPSKFNKIVWTEPKDASFYYCTVDFALDSADLAEASTKTADPGDPAKSGCGGFPWTKLTAKL